MCLLEDYHRIKVWSKTVLNFYFSIKENKIDNQRTSYQNYKLIKSLNIFNWIPNNDALALNYTFKC